MAATRIVLRPAGVEAALGAASTRALVEKGEKVRQRAIQEAPRKTGNLAAHILKRFESHNGEPAMIVGVFGVPYALFVHEGSRPHRIEGNPVLVFDWHGETVFFRSVNHPGNKPNRFLVRALEAVR